MDSKIFLILSALVACIAEINSIHLTKEIDLSVNPNLFVQQQNVPPVLLQEAIKNILLPSRNIAKNVANLLRENSQPVVTDVLEAFNAGVGSNLLVLVDENIQLDADIFETALTDSARKLSQTLYPDNYIQQLTTYIMFQKEIKQISPNIQATLSVVKVPVDQLEKLLLKQPHFVGKRDTSVAIQPKSLWNDLYNAVLSGICNSLLSAIKSVVNSTLLSWVDELEGIDVSTDNNVLSYVVAGGLEVIAFLTEQSLNCTNQWINDNIDISDTCSYIVSSMTNTTNSSRKRRDIAPIVSQKTIFAGVLALLWPLLATVLNICLKIAIAWGSTLVVAALNVFLDTVFPSLF